MNTYDFDETIYKNDSTVDFYFFTLRRKIKILIYIPNLCVNYIKYLLKIIDKTKFKENFFKFVNVYKNNEIDEAVEDFWHKNEYKIYKWYLRQKKDTDVIISASPEFLLKPICKKLNVDIIGSKVDKYTGKFDGKNCHDIEKVVRFKEKYGNVIPEEFYSDSFSDTPMAKYAKNAFRVLKGGKIINWDN